MTKQKKLVLTIIERSHGHLSAEEIFFRAREEECLTLRFGTVYRNLNALTEEGGSSGGLLFRVLPGQIRYDDQTP